MESSLRDFNDVSLLLEISKFSSLGKLERLDGGSINLLLAIRNDFKALNAAISLGKFFNLLNERSRSSSFSRQPISGGRYLQKNKMRERNINITNASNAAYPLPVH